MKTGGEKNLKMDITIREERAGDYEAVLRLTYEAFVTLDYPGRRRMDEHYLIHLLRGSESVIAGLSFVAVYEGEIIGHILYTRSKVIRPDGSRALDAEDSSDASDVSDVETITFGPLSVLPKYQRQGVGAALVRHSMDTAREFGFGAVIIVGVPDYYPKLGFRRASEFGLVLAGEESFGDAFMAYELVPGYLGGGDGGGCNGSDGSGGVVQFLAPEFEIAEDDDAGYEQFHKGFIAEYFPGQLLLRQVFDNDVPLIENWLRSDHVSKWFEHPDDWIHEINNRHGEFSFITHMIAEIDGDPIGFCQYYDCYYSKPYEDWNMPIPHPGEVFSLDYLIGEPGYLRRGFGKKIISIILDILRDAGAKEVVVKADENNHASGRSLLTNGFTKTKDYFSLKVIVKQQA
jgi:predicted N-acetyltransferase YhbS